MKKALVLAIAVIFMFTGFAYAEPEESEIQRVVDVKNEQGELKNCFISNEIAFCSLWGGIVSYEARDMWADLTILKLRGVEDVNIYINSGGGDAFAGMSIADTIRIAQVDGLTINTHASGLIASAAVPIFLSGGYRTASKNTTFMIHRGKLFKAWASDTLSDLDAQREMMQMSENQYVNFLVERSDLTKDDIVEKIDKTTWFSAEQAMEWGFVDTIK